MNVPSRHVRNLSRNGYGWARHARHHASPTLLVCLFVMPLSDLSHRGPHAPYALAAGLRWVPCTCTRSSSFSRSRVVLFPSLRPSSLGYFPAVRQRCPLAARGLSPLGSPLFAPWPSLGGSRLVVEFAGTRVNPTRMQVLFSSSRFLVPFASRCSPT